MNKPKSRSVWEEYIGIWKDEFESVHTIHRIYDADEMDAWVADLARRVLERVNVPHIGRYDVLGYELITDLEALAKGGEDEET